MANSPEQDIFDAVFVIAKKHCDKVYDVRPMDDVGYPFVDFGYTQTLNQPTKTAIKGFVTLEVNVWGLFDQRKAISDIVNGIFLDAVKMRHTKDYAVSVDIQASNIRMLEDTSTNTRLKRAVLELQISF